MEGGSSAAADRRLADLDGSEPEEGEFVPGHHSDADTEEYYNNNLRACSTDSDETISDSAVPANNGGASTDTATNNGGGGDASSAAAGVFACPFCGKEFRNHKAVCGHMKVHREQGIGKDKKGKVHREQGIGKHKKGKVHREEGIGKDKKGIKRNVAAVGGWGAAAKRGCSGSKGSPFAESDQSMAVAAAEAKMIVLDPMPLAFAPPTNLPPVRVTSAKPNPPPVPTASATSNLSSVAVESDAMANDDSVESSSTQPMRDGAMEAVAASPPTEAVVHAAAPPVHQQQPVAAAPHGGRQDPNGYTCKKCNKWFPTHQGLGGHVVGHKNRDLAAALQGGEGAVPNHDRIAKEVKAHVCKVCGAEFSRGIQLGGHMRKHYTGAPLNKKPRHVIPLLPPAPGTATVGVAGLTLALSVKPDETASPAQKPAVVGRVLLFGIDIGTGAKTPAAQEGSSATEASASTTTGGEP